MNGLAVIPQDPTALDQVPDAAAAMVALVDQARTMLAQATGMEGLADVIEWKSRAEAIRVYTQQKDMGHEAELSAAEIVRRAERRIAQLVRDGQAQGEIRMRGEQARAMVTNEDGQATNIPKVSTHEFLPEPAERRDAYAMADDVTDQEFEAALEEARDEGNLTRANVVRKVKNTIIPEQPAPRNLPLKQRADQIRALAAKNLTSPQIADEIGVSADRVRDIAKRAEIEITADAAFPGGFRKVDPNRIIESIIEMATPEPIALARVAYVDLDRDRIAEWVSSLDDAIKSLQTIKRSLTKELTRDQG